MEKRGNVHNYSIPHAKDTFPISFKCVSFPFVFTVFFCYALSIRKVDWIQSKLQSTSLNVECYLHAGDSICVQAISTICSVYEVVGDIAREDEHFTAWQTVGGLRGKLLWIMLWSCESSDIETADTG